MTRPTGVTVDRDAIVHNLGIARQAAGAASLAAVVKANAYGHGLVEVARVVAPRADALAVACLEEGLALRQAGLTCPVLLLEGVFDAAELPTAAAAGFDIVVHEPEQVRALARGVLDTPVAVWIKVDTGMGRLGFDPADVAGIVESLGSVPAVATIGLITHLACGDEPSHPVTRTQLARFAELNELSVQWRSTANSAALMTGMETGDDWVRPGLMLYGASPRADRTAAELDLRPAMHFHSRLIAVRERPAGSTVGYGAGYTCPESMPVGVVAAGYGDGYPRHAPTGTPVGVDGERAPLIGRVSMDMLCVDLRNCPGVRPGAPVTLWGPGLPVDEIAGHAGTIPYDLLCGVTDRVPRTYQGVGHGET